MDTWQLPLMTTRDSRVDHAGWGTKKPRNLSHNEWKKKYQKTGNLNTFICLIYLGYSFQPI